MNHSRKFLDHLMPYVQPLFPRTLGVVRREYVEVVVWLGLLDYLQLALLE